MLPFLIIAYAGALCTLSCLILTTVLVVSHFVDEKTETWRGEITFLSSVEIELDLNPGLCSFKLCS